MSRVMKLFTVVLCFVLVISLASDSFAKRKKKKIRDDDRILKGHGYLRPFRFPLALPTTNVGVGLGYAYTRLNFDEKLDFFLFKDDSFSQGGLNEVIDFEIEFMNRFSIETLFEGRVLAGADENSALLFGGQATYSAAFIPKVMAYQNDSWGTCVSVSMDFLYDQGIQSSPVILMVKLLDNFVELAEDLEKNPNKINNMDESDLRDLANIKLKEGTLTQSYFSIRPSLLYAQTITPVFGFQVGLRYDYGLIEEIDAPEMFEIEAGDPPTSIMFGTVATIDLNPISRAHFGFKLEADYDMTSDDGEDITSLILGGGVMYTGRKHLELGATFFREAESEEDLEYVGYYLILNMRYFF